MHKSCSRVQCTQLPVDFADEAAYDAKLSQLAELFTANFKKYQASVASNSMPYQSCMGHVRESATYAFTA